MLGMLFYCLLCACMALKIRYENINRFDENENLKIFHISDIHLKFSSNTLIELSHYIEKCNPDILVFTGDYYDLPQGAALFKDFLEKITKRYISVFIKGNHDLLFGTSVYEDLFDLPGNYYQVDLNVFKFNSKAGKQYQITSWENRHQLVPNPDGMNIILVHNPGKINPKNLDNIDLILAGHLHGGQIILFKTKRNYNFPGCIFYKNCIDRKEFENSTLIVSKGLGDTLPVRWNCSKEIVYIQIR